MLAYAIHRIIDAVDGKQRITDPGTIFTPNDDDVVGLREQGAIREPTKTELALYGLANPPKSGLGDWDNDGKAGGAAPAAPKAAEPAANEYDLVAVHNGGGKYIVNNAAGELVSGDTPLTKATAAEWIAAYTPPPAAPAEGEDDDI